MPFLLFVMVMVILVVLLDFFTRHMAPVLRWMAFFAFWCSSVWILFWMLHAGAEKMHLASM